VGCALGASTSSVPSAVEGLTPGLTCVGGEEAVSRLPAVAGRCQNQRLISGCRGIFRKLGASVVTYALKNTLVIDGAATSNALIGRTWTTPGDKIGLPAHVGNGQTAGVTFELDCVTFPDHFKG
jgi:hypothetical protein